MSEKRFAMVTQEQTVHTHAELWHASRCLLDRGCNEPKGSSWQFLSSLVLTAFAFEAFMNHVGEHVLQIWNRTERMSPEEKLEALCVQLKITDLPRGRKPRQTIQELFKFRDTMAHGRTERLAPKPRPVPVDQVEEELWKAPLSDWQKKVANETFARQAQADVEAVCKAIHEKLPEPRGLLFGFGMGIYSATVE